MEEQAEYKPKGRKPKPKEESKTHRVELRLTDKQKELLDWVMSEMPNAKLTGILINAIFVYAKQSYNFTPEMQKEYFDCTRVY